MHIAPLAQLRTADDELWQTVYLADEQTMKQALSAALLGDRELARRIVESGGAWRVMDWPDLTPEPASEPETATEPTRTVYVRWDVTETYCADVEVPADVTDVKAWLDENPGAPKQHEDGSHLSNPGTEREVVEVDED